MQTHTRTRIHTAPSRSADLIDYTAEEGLRSLGQGELLNSDSFPGQTRNKLCLVSKVGGGGGGGWGLQRRSGGRGAGVAGAYVHRPMRTQRNTPAALVRRQPVSIALLPSQTPPRCRWASSWPSPPSTTR